MKAKASKCKCGCSEIPIWPSDYITGHDLIHRNKLIDRAGGVDKLTELLDRVDIYMAGEIGESDLAKEIRRLRSKL